LSIKSALYHFKEKLFIGNIIMLFSLNENIMITITGIYRSKKESTVIHNVGLEIYFLNICILKLEFLKCSPFTN